MTTLEAITIEFNKPNTHKQLGISFPALWSYKQRLAKGTLTIDSQQKMLKKLGYKMKKQEQWQQPAKRK